MPLCWRRFAKLGVVSLRVFLWHALIDPTWNAHIWAIDLFIYTVARRTQLIWSRSLQFMVSVFPGAGYKLDNPEQTRFEECPVSNSVSNLCCVCLWWLQIGLCTLNNITRVVPAKWAVSYLSYAWTIFLCLFSVHTMYPLPKLKSILDVLLSCWHELPSYCPMMRLCCQNVTACGWSYTPCLETLSSSSAELNKWRL